MQRTMLKSKIHRATVTDCDLHYVGSITIDPDLLEAADIREFEQVAVVAGRVAPLVVVVRDVLLVVATPEAPGGRCRHAHIVADRPLAHALSGPIIAELLNRFDGACTTRPACLEHEVVRERWGGCRHLLNGRQVAYL